MNIVDRFLKYVSFCTTSDENTGMTPSTPGQMEFARYLAEELKSIGLSEVTLDENGYIMATLPSNVQRDNVQCTKEKKKEVIQMGRFPFSELCKRKCTFPMIF